MHAGAFRGNLLCVFPRVCVSFRVLLFLDWKRPNNRCVLHCCVVLNEGDRRIFSTRTDSENPSTRQSASCQTMILIVESTYFALSRCQRAFVHTRTASQRRQDEVMAFATNCCGDEWVASLNGLAVFVYSRCYVRWVWLYSS